MEIIARPATKRGRKGDMQEKLKALKPNSNECEVIQENKSSGAYTAAKTANLSISIHKLEGREGYVGVYSNGPRQS